MASKYDTVYVCDPLFRTVGHMNLLQLLSLVKLYCIRGVLTHLNMSLE